MAKHEWVYPTKEVHDPDFVQTDPPTPDTQIPTVEVADTDRPPISCSVCELAHVTLSHLRVSECPGPDHDHVEDARPLHQGKCRFCGIHVADAKEILLEAKRKSEARAAEVAAVVAGRKAAEDANDK